MFGGGGEATLEAFPIPLGSTNTLVAVPIAAPVARLPPEPVAAEPECPATAEPPPPRANEAAGVVRATLAKKEAEDWLVEAEYWLAEANEWRQLRKSPDPVHREN